MNINISLSSAEGMIRILSDLSIGREVTRKEILYFLNNDEGCKMQFKFYGSDIQKDQYVDMIFSVKEGKSYETENPILKKMYSSLKNIYSNLALLYKKLDNIKQFNFKRFEEKLISSLPTGTELNLNIFFCLDGFNGGSIVDKNTMCLDVLFWPSKKELEINIEGVVLHEFHHIGLLYWLNKNNTRNNLLINKDKNSLIVNLMQGVLSEGAAVYFFNKEQDLYELILEGYGEELGNGFKDSYLDSWNNIDEKMDNFNKLILQLLDDKIDNYDLLNNETDKYYYMIGNEEALNKVIGRYMCSVIEEGIGRHALIDSFINLQNFPIHYDKACEQIGKQGLDNQAMNKWKKLWGM